MGRKRKVKTFDQIEIIDIANKGKCIGRTLEGEIVLVEDVVPGDQITGNALRKKKGLWQVRPTEFLRQSPDRVTPKCRHFDDCGGCKWQNLSMEKQLFYKEKQVFQTVRRLGEVTDFDALPIVASPKAFEFRNKMEFSFSDQRWLSSSSSELKEESAEKGGLGLHPPGWFSKVVDIDTCHLIPPFVNDIRNFVRKKSRELNLTFYNSRNHVGDMRNLMIRVNRQNEVMIVFIFGSPPDNRHVALMDSTKETFDQIVSVYSILNQKVNDSTFDLEAELIHGAQYLDESIGHVKFKIGPKSFFQTNIYQTEQLYAEVKRLTALTGSEVVYDLYSGIGSIALYVADRAKQLIAVEDVPEAVDDARLNAKLNAIEHIEYYTGKMEKLIESDQLNALPKPDVIITDPPRAGMHESVTKFILHQQPDRIVYVSCDPATQARDIKLLTAMYKLESVQPFDMFPHTSHVESIALLTLK